MADRLKLNNCTKFNRHCNSVRPSAGRGPAFNRSTVDLLVMQSTPFCNIDCSYCYLPHRNRRDRMPATVLEAVREKIVDAGYTSRAPTVVWHAGEPTTLPPSYYRDAIDRLTPRRRSDIRLRQSFQTNATLIDRSWISFFKETGANVGVSLDGPAGIHDASRRTRRGQGTHARTMRGVEQLQDAEIPFHVIAVLTRDALDHPDLLFAFFHEYGLYRVGFNVEEVELANPRSSLQAAGSEAAYRRFLKRFLGLNAQAGWPIAVREFDAMRACVVDRRDPGAENVQAQVFRILCIDDSGGVSTFSPELLGARSAEYDDFLIGNILEDDVETILRGPVLARLQRDVLAGVSACERTCDYFRLCGGGAPANKFFENGDLTSTETMYCRLTKKAVAEEVLAWLEATVPPGSKTDGVTLDAATTSAAGLVDAC